eukprot:275834_1
MIMASIKECIKRLSSGADITPESARDTMKEILEGTASAPQIGAFLALYSAERTSGEAVAALSKEMRSHCLSLIDHPNSVDIVGTGGDGHDTFNISTAASFVVAGAGAVVAKHGNRASSSKCGSADLVEALGANLDLGPEEVSQILNEVGFCFLFARKFHPAMKQVGTIRRDIGIRTVFNILGPLSNPCKPKSQMLGVCKPELGPLYAKASLVAGVENTLVVCGYEGLDEISIAGPTHTWTVKHGTVTKGVITPEDFGIKRHPLAECAGGGSEDNVKILKDIIDGVDSAVADFVLINAAATLFICGIAKDYKDGVRLAREAISSGKVKGVVDKYVRMSQAVGGSGGKEYIITKIVRVRRKAIDQKKADLPLMAMLLSAEPPPVIDFYDRIRAAAPMGIMAEIKRKSPSKGLIAPGVDPFRQAEAYARGGAVAISVLTEPAFFDGSLEDLRGVRKVIDGMKDRPAVLLKDFVIDEYQIYEARSYGADTVLLIVSMYPEDELKRFIEVSRSLGMEPLVEVHTEPEMDVALSVGARVIGVNNRDLRTFKVDMDTTARLAQRIPDSSDVALCALSGIVTRAHVEHFAASGACACLIGETLMRSSNPERALRELVGVEVDNSGNNAPLVKVCGVNDPAMGVSVAQSGADLIGLLMVPGRRRTVSVKRASEIVWQVRMSYMPPLVRAESEDGATVMYVELPPSTSKSDWFSAWRREIDSSIKRRRPLIVGVFLDQTAEEINAIAEEVDLDLIQLHGSEGFEFARKLCRPVIRTVHVSAGDDATSVLKKIQAGDVAAILLDAKIGDSTDGGTGKTFDWDVAAGVAKEIPIILAGGLTPSNVSLAVNQVSPWAVDVASGCETSGRKDLAKVNAFVKNAKNYVNAHIAVESRD